MHIIVVGFNYRTTPIELREKLTISTETLPLALQDLHQRKSILECVIVSTCNRTEIYAVVDKLERTRHYILSFIEEQFQIKRDDFQSYLYIHEEAAAVRHLFRVTSGLESMIIGETQILGQVKAAFFAAQKCKTTGTWFNKLFKEAITIAKRAQRETSIADHPVSIAYAAVELARQKLGSLKGKSAVVLGAGEMSKLALRHLRFREIDKLYITNRSYERAEQFAEFVQATPYPWEQREKLFSEVDVVISATGADTTVITKDMVQPCVSSRQGNPLIMVDIALPRDIEPEVGLLKDVKLFDIDDLQSFLDEHHEKRIAEAKKIEKMIEVEIERFYGWVATLGVVPIMQALQQKSSHIYEETMKNLYQRLPDLSDHERKVIGKLTKSIVNQLLRDPITWLKEVSAQPNGDEAIADFVRIFGLESYVNREEDEKPIVDQTMHVVK